MEFLVSVIIPVYNVAEYVRSAVESAVFLPEVGEVILVEDGSPDNSFQICLKLEKEYRKVRLFRHPSQQNKGVSASRNLGIGKAQFPYIAFLDADDWYLNHRFKKDKLIFELDSNVDVTFSCSILEKDFGQNEKRYGVKSSPEFKWGKDLKPLDFYRQKLESRNVLFNTNTITIKKDSLKKEKLFDERLNLHEDSELWNRLMRRGVFRASEWENPVAVIRRHAKNNIVKRNIYSHLKMMAVQIDNIGLNNLHDFEVKELFTSILREKSKKYKKHWKRRGYFYGMYMLNFFRKIDLLDQTRKAYAFN